MTGCDCQGVVANNCRVPNLRSPFGGRLVLLLQDSFVPEYLLYIWTRHGYRAGVHFGHEGVASGIARGIGVMDAMIPLDGLEWGFQTAVRGSVLGPASTGTGF
jgi:hypothetical protein